MFLKFISNLSHENILINTHVVLRYIRNIWLNLQQKIRLLIQTELHFENYNLHNTHYIIIILKR